MALSTRVRSFVPFAALSFLCVVSLALGMGWALSSLLTSAVSEWEWGNTAALVRREIEMTGLDRRMASGAAGDRWGRELSRLLTSLPEVMRIAVWDPSGTVLWSDQAELIGRRFPENAELRTALTGRVEVKIRKPGVAEQRYERRGVTAIALVYVPVLERGTGRVLGVVEVYKTPTRLLETIHRGRVVVWAISLAGGLLLYAVLVPLFTQIYRREVEDRTLRAHAGRLEQEVAERTLQVEQQAERLIQAQKMEAVGRLAGGIAHDFNNLLTVILGRAQLALALRRTGASAQQELEVINETAARAAELTRQLLAFSRKQVLELAVIDLTRVVSEMAAMLERLIGPGIALTADLGGRPAWIRADRAQIEQVIVNLIVNARDAMPAGGRLAIRVASEEAPAEGRGPRVLMSIADTGTGMPPEVQARIFEPFFTTKDAERGTGLGLATAYGTVKQHGGHIEVESAPGAGTTFRIDLPRAEAPARAETPAPTCELASGSEVVLLVEDEAPVRSLVRRILEAGGYTVLTASSGQAARELLAAHSGPLDLLLTDVVMPGESGPELAGALVRAYPDLRVLYTSGHTEDAMLRGVAEAPFLAKPFAPAALLVTVREVLDSHLTARAA